MSQPIRLLSHEIALPPITRKLRKEHPELVKWLDDFTVALRTRHADISNAVTLVTQTPPKILSFSQSPFVATLLAQGNTLFQCSASASAPFVLRLPQALGTLKYAIVKKLDANNQPVAVTPFQTDTIDGSNSVLNITLQGDVVRFHDTAIGAWTIA